MEKDKSFKLASIPKNEGLELKIRKNENIKEKLLKYKKLFLTNFNKLKIKIKKYPNISILIMNIFGMLLYGISLKGCYGGAENYCATTFIKIFVLLGILVLIDSFLISITLILIQKRIANYVHLIYIFIIYYLYYSYDHGGTLVRHGFHNMTFFILFSFMFYIVLNFLLCLKKLYENKKYIKMTISIIIPPSLVFSFLIYANIKSSCKDFSLGYNNTRIINLENEA